MICRGKGENKGYSDRVIGEVLKNWDKIMYGKTTDQEGEEKESPSCNVLKRIE